MKKNILNKEQKEMLIKCLDCYEKKIVKKMKKKKITEFQYEQQYEIIESIHSNIKHL